MVNCMVIFCLPSLQASGPLNTTWIGFPVNFLPLLVAPHFSKPEKIDCIIFILKKKKKKVRD